jgi:hypothetical protein
MAIFVTLVALEPMLVLLTVVRMVTLVAMVTLVTLTPVVVFVAMVTKHSLALPTIAFHNLA